MKRYIKQLRSWSFVLIGILTLSSCKENVFKATEFKPGIYFLIDSTDYSFGITPLEVTSYDLMVPVRIMGAPIGQDRTFTVKVLAENTNSIEEVHFEILSLLIKADSVNGELPLRLLRSELGTDFFKVTLQLVDNNEFVAVSESMAKTVVTFNNRLEQPNWVNWNNVKSWPSNKLGTWNPLTYVKFMELVGKMADTVPSTYNAIITKYGGPLMPQFPGDWAWDYDFSLSKYALIPLYQYFMEEHVELGVKIPRPSGY